MDGGALVYNSLGYKGLFIVFPRSKEMPRRKALEIEVVRQKSEPDYSRQAQQAKARVHFIVYSYFILFSLWT